MLITSIRQAGLAATAYWLRLTHAQSLLKSRASIFQIKEMLGYDKIELSTMVYLQLDLSKRKIIQQQFIQYVQSDVTQNPEIDELIDWQNKDDIIAWLDDL